MNSRDYEQIARQADRLPTEYKLCRLGHRLKQIATNQRGRYYDCTDRCERCPYEVEYTLDHQGFYVLDTVRRRQPDKTYSVRGYGVGASAVIRARLRLQHRLGQL